MVKKIGLQRVLRTRRTFCILNQPLRFAESTFGALRI
jgi:hypothetical protein